MSTGKTLECISPIDGSVYASRDVMTREQAAGKLNAASAAQREWCNRSLAAGARGLVDGHAFAACKDTGCGAGLSLLRYQSVTRPKSYHFRKQS